MLHTAQVKPEAPTQGPRWDAALLEADTQVAVEAWKQSIHGFAKRLSPINRAKFIMGLDTATYFMAGESAIAANDGRHPKHDILKYAAFFVKNIKAGERVLDLGCGKGELAISIALKTGALVTGMDWSEESLRSAQANAKGSQVLTLNLHKGDITTCQLPTHFDTIILSNVLEHITARVNRLRMWSKWYAPKQFLIRVPAHDRDWRTGWKDQLGVDSRCDPTHETEYTLESLTQELHQAGLALQSCSIQWGEYWCVAVPVGQAEQPSRPQHGEVNK